MVPSPQLARDLAVSVSAGISTVAAKTMNLYAQLFSSFFTANAAVAHPETLADRLAYVSQLQINPRKFVGYVGQQVAFRALPLNASGETIQGVRFDWESSDTDKVQIDDAGYAHLLHPGLVRLTCHAGNVSASAPLLVRPGSRPRQTDLEWRLDQNALRPDGTDTIGQSNSSGEGVVAALLDHLAPTAEAQVMGGGGSSGDLIHDELWSDVRNLVGHPRNRAAESTRIGTVLPEGSNFNFAAPIISLGGRGIGANLALYYNSRVWSRRGNSVAFDAIGGWPAPGFSLGFGRIVTYEISAGLNPTCKYMLIDPDGTRHYLGSGSWAGSGYALGGPFETNDGSHIVYTGNGSHGGDLHYPDGTTASFTMVNNCLLPTSISDTNGNYVQIAYKPECFQVGTEEYCDVFAPMAIDYITDTMGRVIQFNYDSNYRLTSITAPGFGGSAQQPVTQTVVQFDYQTVTTGGTFSGLTVEHGTGGSITTLKHIYFPATGTGYIPSYSIYGQIISISGRRQMSIGWPNTIQDGVESNNVSFNYPTSGPLTDAPAFTLRTETAVSAPTSTYWYSRWEGQGYTVFIVLQPDGTYYTMGRYDPATAGYGGLLYYVQPQRTNGTPMHSTFYSYANDGGGEPQVVYVNDSDETGAGTLVGFAYDQYGNVTNKYDYGYQVNGQWLVRRRTRNIYKTDSSYVNAYMRGLVIENDIYDSMVNDSVPVAKTTYTYDDYQAMGGMEDYRDPDTGQLPPNPPGHLSWYNTALTVRGNVTGMTQWYDIANNLSYTHLRKIDVYGNIVKEQLSCCNEQTQMASQTYNWAVAEQVTKGSTSGAQLTYSKQYDFNTMAVKSATDPNQQTTVNAYDGVLRATSVSAPGGKIASAGYNDSGLSVTSTVTYDDGGTQKTITTTTDYDGWGRVIHETNIHGGQVNTTYDNMGRVASVSNPFAIGGSPSYWTNYSYDALGRQTTVTSPDNQMVQNTFSGNSVMVIDQVNRKIQRISDGLGRLVTINEQDAAGNVTQATNYTYDILNNLTQVNQGNQLRSYKYDALSRLTAEKIPEQGDPTQANQWTTTYTYTDFDQVATRTDARGVVTSYAYDTLNRLTQMSYNTVSGVMTAPTVTYNYDSYNGTTANGKLVRVAVGTDYEERYTFDSKFRIASTVRTIGTRSYTSGYSYNGADQMTQATYPSLRQLGFSYDNVGRLSSMSYMNNVTYDIAGHVNGDTLGNGVTEQFGYDPATMQMTSQNAGTVSPFTNRVNLSYIYNATTGGQFGVSTSTGNADQMVSASGTINGTTESASYTYDNYGRLVTSNQTSNGQTAQRRFAYDRWNNRTGVWDAVSGGTQIQSVSVQTASFPGTGSAPTNRVSAVNGTSYLYDPSGNVTYDGAHNYMYDSENRLVSVDGGATASYAYDHQNRRYKKVAGGSVTHYVWQGGQVLAEHNGSTGAVLVDYIYNGSQMIAKVVSGATSYFLSDRLSARLTLDASGNVVGRQGHLPFGEDFAESGSQSKIHLTTYERDGEKGTDYATNRHYSFADSKFMTPDPYRGSGQTSSPQSWNRYAYVLNDPINSTDPTGLTRCAIGLHNNGDVIQGFYRNESLGRVTGPVTTSEFYGYLLEVVFTWQETPVSGQGVILVYYQVQFHFEKNLTYFHKRKGGKREFDDQTGDIPNYGVFLQAVLIPGVGEAVALLYLPSVVARKYPDNPRFRLGYDAFHPVSFERFKYTFTGYDELHRERCRASIDLVFNYGIVSPDGSWDYRTTGLP
ncbi:MAG TPA: RHS repeat-associated core domain-containing protein [Blastocatellia bacterium]|nr:RHS repeat-associated core domain-containing protein [Blastocatellia bacterium]